MEYIIPHRGNNLGRIFGVMETNKQVLFIADYSVSQTTLDQVFINFAKSSANQDDSDESDEELEEEENGDDSIFDAELEQKKEEAMTRVDLPPLDGGNVSPINDHFDANNTNRNINDTPTFEAIKNHFNSLKKTRHIRKTSSAKSQDFKQSQRSRRSQRSRSASIKQRKSITEQGGFTNMAYENDYKNGDGLDMPIQESSHDLTMSITEDGEFYSRC